MKQISCIKVRFVSHTNFQDFSPVLLVEETNVNLELLLKSITTYRFYISFGQAPEDSILKLSDFITEVINLKLYKKVTILKEFSAPKFLDKFYSPQFYIDNHLYNGEWYSFFKEIDENSVREILHDVIYCYRGISKSNVPYCKGKFCFAETKNAKIKALVFTEKSTKIIEINELLNY